MSEDTDDNIRQLIAAGNHWLMIGDNAGVTSVQALTDAGLAALQEVFAVKGIPAQQLKMLGRKRRGYYHAAIAMSSGAETLANVLVEHFGLPGVYYKIGGAPPELRWLPQVEVVAGTEHEPQ